GRSTSPRLVAAWLALVLGHQLLVFRRNLAAAILRIAGPLSCRGVQRQQGAVVVAKKKKKKNRSRPKRQRPAGPAKFAIGTLVRVKRGTQDPDFSDIPIGGWSGTITDVEEGRHGWVCLIA